MVLTKAINTSFWFKFSVFNFLLLAIIGVIMRYKICYEFTFVDQKHLQLAHSNFAFVAWVTQTLMVLMIAYLKEYISVEQLKSYQPILIANVISAYGMLFSFASQGYGIISIVFSTITVLVSCWFTFQFVKHLNTILSSPSKMWFKAALFCMLISTVGTFSLAYMMATKHIDQHVYLATIYWYLHFQYNGWFFFACIGLLINLVKQQLPGSNQLKVLFYMFFVGCLVTYILSILWLNLHIGFVIFAMIGAFLQLWAWFKLFVLLKKPISVMAEKKSPILKYILMVLAIAVGIKFMLQLGSTIPMVSKLAFGFRPVVIAYLHLVLLAIISVFLVLFMWLSGIIGEHKYTAVAIGAFVVMVYLNQIVLGVQAIASFANYYFIGINELLLAIAVLLVASLCFVFIVSTKRRVNM